MKTLLYSIAFILVASFTLVSCDGDDPNTASILTQVITLPNGDQLSVGESFEHEVLQGIDSQVGRIFSEELNMSISYDIGFLAGEYVDATSSTCDMAVNSTFCWRSDTSNIYATFRDLGPANFICKLGNDSLFLEIMRTVEDK